MQVNDHEDHVLETEAQLYAIFRGAEKPKSAFRVGAEMEKFGVYADGSPIPYEGGVDAIFDQLAPLGYEAQSEVPGGPRLALLRDGASVTLEPGSQVELSGAPLFDMHAIAAEALAHQDELDAIGARLGISWLGVGFHPFSKRADYTFVPKLRYDIMKQYLPTRGSHALDMMLRTATVQANFDYESETDAIRKLQVGLRLSPLNIAMFANSPWVEGKAYGGKTYRGRVWLDVDPDRSGMLPEMHKPGVGYADYVRWALAAPMFMVKRDGKAVHNTGQTFADFWKNGFEGHRALESDWETHLNTLFPEVRLKRTIEIRSADSLPLSLMPALSALWTGIFYDAASLDEAEKLSLEFEVGQKDDLMALRRAVPEQALAAEFHGRKLAGFAQDLVAIAQRGLKKRAICNQKGQDETVHLEPLAALIAQSRCPADVLLERSKGGTREEVMKAAAVRG
jgi:glutamate--cysteine ligase